MFALNLCNKKPLDNWQIIKGTFFTYQSYVFLFNEDLNFRRSYISAGLGRKVNFFSADTHFNHILKDLGCIVLGGCGRQLAVFGRAYGDNVKHNTGLFRNSAADCALQSVFIFDVRFVKLGHKQGLAGDSRFGTGERHR